MLDVWSERYAEPDVVVLQHTELCTRIAYVARVSADQRPGGRRHHMLSAAESPARKKADSLRTSICRPRGRG